MWTRFFRFSEHRLCTTGIKMWPSEHGRWGGGSRVPSGRGRKVFGTFASILPLFAETGPPNGFKPPFQFIDRQSQPHQLGLFCLWVIGTQNNSINKREAYSVSCIKEVQRLAPPRLVRRLQKTIEIRLLPSHCSEKPNCNLCPYNSGSLLELQPGHLHAWNGERKEGRGPCLFRRLTESLM